jgi:hypothetical protein
MELRDATRQLAKLDRGVLTKTLVHVAESLRSRTEAGQTNPGYSPTDTGGMDRNSQVLATRSAALDAVGVEGAMRESW